MNKNTLIGFLLIGLIFFAYSYYTKPTPEQKAAQERYRDSITTVQTQELLEIQLANQQKLQADSINLQTVTDSIREIQMKNTYGEFAHAAEGEETFITLENELLEVILSSKGGRIHSVNLKQYASEDKGPLILFEGAEESMFNTTLVTVNNRIINTKDFYFQTIIEDNKVTMRLNAGNSSYLDYVYTLDADNYFLHFEVHSKGLDQILPISTNSLDIQWGQKALQQEIGRSFESRYSYLSYKYTSGDVEHLSESKKDSENISNRVKWIGFKNQYFSSVLIADNNFESIKLESIPFDKGKYIKEYNAITTIPFDVRGLDATKFHYYFGPNDYQLLKKYDRELFKGQDLQLEKLVPLGWQFFRSVNKWIVIPLFNFFIDLCGNIGIAILLLTIAIKTLLFPLSYKSFMSSAKMRVMRPQVEVINKKYPGQENAMVRQQKTMALYQQAGVNPMSGCLPMLLQMPFFIALFQFFPTAIELRHESFLWAKDLSTYDAIISWKTYIPLVTPYFGNHVSLFCLLMTITQILNTKFNMDQTNTGQQQMPGMKGMMYIMPVFMLIFLNQYPAGLNYYYFISTLITVIQMAAFRYFVNEEKLLLQLEANKKKPAKKKSGFMARLEEAQRQQQALAKQRAKTGKR